MSIHKFKLIMMNEISKWNGGLVKSNSKSITCISVHQKKKSAAVNSKALKNDAQVIFFLFSSSSLGNYYQFSLPIYLILKQHRTLKQNSI